MELKSNILLAALSFLAVGTMAFNIYLEGEISKDIEVQKNQISYLSLSAVPAQNTAQSSAQAQGQTVISFEDFLPKGVPPIYGRELGVSFDKPTESLSILSALDGDLYETGLLKFSDLTKEQQEDYIKIGMSIACEYCCGVNSLIAPNGQPACGCAHSAAMRGLAKYMLKNHYGEMSNEQILEQLTLWKTMFFPKQMYKKAIELQAKGENLTGTVLDNVPDMVGGC